MKAMRKNAKAASDFLKTLANQHRLMVLCALAEGEHNVAELVEITGISQSSMSQHLGKLKAEKLVDFRRDHRELHYYIKDPNALRVLGLLHDIYCK
jgi:DNA-binding transcriptional ArsR family regulator